MATGLQGCVFCDIVQRKTEQHLRESQNAVVIKDIGPHAPHHYLVLSKRHICKADDLTVADIDLVKEMERTGREYLREALKQKGEADIVEDLLRIGFHMHMMISVQHLHMHVLYPVNEMNFIYRNTVFRPGRFFRLAQDVIAEFEKQRNQDGKTDIEQKLEGNPALSDPKALPDKRISAKVVTTVGSAKVD